MTALTSPALEDCLREPIHLSGCIQPHGYLVSCRLADWSVQHVSANIEGLFGVAPSRMLGASLREFIEDDVLQVIEDTATFSDPGAAAQRAGTANIGDNLSVCDLSVHLSDGLVHIEIEPQPFRTSERAPAGVAQAMIARVGSGDDPLDFFQRTAEQVRVLLGFDRVMVYRFRPDDSGEVVAEACAADLEPYLGLRYPATDIPPQARALYLRNRLRVIPDAGYTAVPILPGKTAGGTPLDLSQHVLRGVSPVHLEYLRNMGVAASMSISIVSGGRLWGLIACHHRTPRSVPAGIRAAADLFGMFVSMRVSAREQEASMERYESAQRVRDALALRLSQARDFDAALVEELPLLGRSLGSDGAALWLGGRWHASGRTPGPAAQTPLIDWLRRAGRPLLAMTEVGEDWRTRAMQADGTAGVMAINLGGGDDWLFLFRSEQVEDVRWAGEPHKAMVVTDDGQRIAPRKSFAEWRETVRGRSVGWSEIDRSGAERLHRVLREQRRRAGAQASGLHELDAFQHRQVLVDQKRRLGEIATLLDGLAHLDAAETARIESRIARLESDLRQLMRRSHEVDGMSGEAMTVGM